MHLVWWSSSTVCVSTFISSIDKAQTTGVQEKQLLRCWPRCHWLQPRQWCWIMCCQLRHISDFYPVLPTTFDCPQMQGLWLWPSLGRPCSHGSPFLFTPVAYSSKALGHGYRYINIFKMMSSALIARMLFGFANVGVWPPLLKCPPLYGRQQHDFVLQCLKCDN